MYTADGRLVDYMDEDHEAWIEASVQRTLGLEWAKHIEPKEVA